ncbi:MAG: hypothetical protein J5626_07490 [Lachnospiraceae bacterium]|nr:hypothetical protein [Lachnospiraceae bacterium]
MSEHVKGEQNIAPEEKENLSELYNDEVQASVVSMQKSADTYTERYHEKPFGKGDIILDIISFFVYVTVAFGWLLLMLLCISFVARSVFHMQFTTMLIVSGIFAFITAVVVAVRKTKKYLRLNDEARRYKERSKE